MEDDVSGETLLVPVPFSSAEVHNRIEASLHPHQLRVLAAIKAYGQVSIAEALKHTGLSHENNVRSVWLLWYLGIIEAHSAAGVMRLRVVPAEQRPSLPMPSVLYSDL